jgi:hypothetical protein
MLWGGWCEWYWWYPLKIDENPTFVGKQNKSATFGFRICYFNQSFFHPNHTL